MRRLIPLLVLLAACGGTDAADSPPLTASLAPATGTSTARLVQVVLRGGSGVDVTSVRLRGAGFVQVPAQPVAGTVPAGGELGLPLAYGPVLCEGRAAPTVVELGTATGPIEVPVDQDALLPGLRAAECAQQ